MNTVKLYFPSVDKTGSPIESQLSTKIYKEVIRDISQLSGGVTVYPCQGYYINSTGKLINDDISLITAFTNQLDKMTELIKNESMLILKSLNQESVLIEINNHIEFITSES